MQLLNERTSRIVAAHVELADTRTARRRGLLGRQRMDADAAMVITRCPAVHTAFMRFAIDVAFVDRDGRAVRLVRGLRPWRMAGAMRAHAAIELAAGQLDANGVRLGDRLLLAPDSAHESRAADHS